jgi:hypothetical protein
MQFELSAKIDQQICHPERTWLSREMTEHSIWLREHARLASDYIQRATNAFRGTCFNSLAKAREKPVQGLHLGKSASKDSFGQTSQAHQPELWSPKSSLAEAQIVCAARN